jgi:hypothetical protein
MRFPGAAGKCRRVSQRLMSKVPISFKRERFALGVGGGILVALSAVFTLSAFGIEFRQVGGSPGRTCFLGIWAAVFVYALLERMARRGLAVMLGLSGVLLIVAAGAPSGANLSEVQLGAGALGLSGCVAAWRSWRLIAAPLGVGTATEAEG